MAKKPLEVDMIAGSQLRDTQGEMLSVEGADITDLQNGKGRLNDNHGKGFFNSIGRVTTAKKIFKAEDCENDRHRYYWEQVKAPFIYVAGQLYDDEDHPNAKAAAAILRNIHKKDLPLRLKASVEGGVIARGIKDQSLLARTKIHSVALTFTPANNATLVEPISLDKSFVDETADMELIKSVQHLAQTNVPSFRHITRDASASRVRKNLQTIAELTGSGEPVPSKEEIINTAIQEKIRKNVEKINALVKSAKEQESLDKGVKEAVAGAAMMGAAALAPGNPGKAPSEKAPAVKATHSQVYKQIARSNPVLGAIGFVESSGGKNLKHRTINNPNSVDHGHTAGGAYGLMPNSAAFILKHDKALAAKYPKYADMAKDLKTHHKAFTEAFNSDPHMDAEFATALLNRNKSKTKNMHMLIHSWNHGVKGTWNKLKEGGHDAIANDDYVKSVASRLPSKEPKRSIASVKKALTAGYGGAGAPGSMTGGAVIQSESLEKPKGFKYVTCDKCGKEQILAKHQVKCRECRQNWSLEKLYTAMKASKGD